MPNKFFDHVLGVSEVRNINGTPMGGWMLDINGPYLPHGCCSRGP
jgi:hypothetical protein